MPVDEEPAALRARMAELLRDAVIREDETPTSHRSPSRAPIGALAAATGLRILGVDLGARSAIARAGGAGRDRSRAACTRAAGWPGPC